MIELEQITYWQHYPEGDALDKRGRYQWYFHIHAPKSNKHASRHSVSAERGHIHLFAVEKRAGRVIALRHLLAIGVAQSGMPRRLFTVNGWVTGDAPRSARWSWRALAALRLSTGHRDLDRFITETVKLYPREIKTLLRASDLKLRQIGVDRTSAARNRRVEVLGSVLLPQVV